MSHPIDSLAPTETPEILLEKNWTPIWDLLSRADFSKINQDQLGSWTHSTAQIICAGKSIKFTSDFLRRLRSQVQDRINGNISSNGHKGRDSRTWVMLKFNRDDWEAAERQLRKDSEGRNKSYRFEVVE